MGTMKSAHFKWKMIMIHTDRTLKLYFQKKKKKRQQKENTIVQTPNSKYTNCECLCRSASCKFEACPCGNSDWVYQWISIWEVSGVIH